METLRIAFLKMQISEIMEPSIEKKQARGYGIAVAISAVIARKWIQILISVLMPILFSIYFVKDTQSISLGGINEFILQTWLWLLFSTGVIAYISWRMAKYLNRTLPFRGFVISSTIIFVLCYIGLHNIHFGNDGHYLYMYVIYVVTSYTAMFLGLCWNRWINKASPEEQKEINVFIDSLYPSIKIVSDYGAVLEKTSEERLLSVPESRLPHSKEKIKNAIGGVEFFIEKALNDESFGKLFIENHDNFGFDKTQAEYLLSEKYRELLKTCLACLDVFVSDEEAEKGNEQ
jgi:hypothetical protein